MLIALLLNGLVDWNNNRELVEQARSTIRREVEANLKELEGLPESVKRSGGELENALRLANDLISTGKTDIAQSEPELQFRHAEPVRLAERREHRRARSHGL